MSFRQFLRIALIPYATASFAQTEALDREAENYELNSFSQYQWLPFQGDYFVYYAIPAQGNLTHTFPITRFIRAHDITTTVQSSELTPADKMNGLEWKGQVAIYAAAAREYDLSAGWGTWISHQALMFAEVEKINGHWHGSYRVGFTVPPDTVFQRPEQEDLPLADAGHPKAGGPAEDPQDRVNHIISQSLASIDECYRGVHPYFNEDVVGWALDKVFQKVIEPGGVCDQYLKGIAAVPLKISIPLAPWLPGLSVSLDTEKLCTLLQHPRCPD